MTATVGGLANQIRSKNAGPFWMTIDVFFDDEDAFDQACGSALTDPAVVGPLYATDPRQVRVFRLDRLRAIKISLPRPTVQGSIGDRDMHAGQQYVPLLDLPVGAHAGDA
jgi:hypothetical protein